VLVCILIRNIKNVFV